MIQNDRKQDVFQQLQGWIQFGIASLAPHVLNHNTLGREYAEQLLFSHHCLIHLKNSSVQSIEEMKEILNKQET